MNNETEAPELFSPYHDGSMQLDTDGGWVSLDDYKNLSDAQAKRIDELEAKNRELAMQVIASDSQAQMAYEQQEKLEAKLAHTTDQYRLVGMDKINLVARVAELEAKLAKAAATLQPFSRFIDKEACKITVIWTDESGYRSTYRNTLKPDDFFKARDTIAELKGTG